MTSSSSVRLVFFESATGRETCAPTRRLLQELVASDNRLTLETLDLALDRDAAHTYGVDCVPAIVLAASGRDRIRFYGAPLGREWGTFIDAIGMTATGETGLSSAARARLSALTQPVHIQVFFTPTCVYCPEMIAMACRFAVESPLVTAAAIDATEFPDLVRRHNVNGVPKTVLNGTLEILGPVAEEELLRRVIEVGTGVEARSASPIC